jgi:hypothetical protein
MEFKSDSNDLLAKLNQGQRELELGERIPAEEMFAELRILAQLIDCRTALHSFKSSGQELDSRHFESPDA